MKDGLLTIDQAAAYLAVSRSTIYRMIGKRELRPVRLGHVNRIRLADLRVITAEREENATT